MISFNEQIELYEEMMKHPYVDLYQCSLSMLKRRMDGGQISSGSQIEEAHKNEIKQYEDPNSLNSKLLTKTKEIMQRNNASKNTKTSLPKKYKLFNGFVGEYCCHHQMNGSLGKHYDDAPGLVILYSIGCTANFYVKSPRIQQENGITFKFESGDVFIFDCSEKAKILHAVISIDAHSCPTELQQRYAKLGEHRYSLQTRMEPTEDE